MAAPMAKAALLLALLLPAVPALPSPADQAAPPPPRPPDAEPAIAQARIAQASAEASFLTAKGLRSLADTAWGLGLKATAAGLYRHLLEYSPDDPHARDRLGWRRRGVLWERDKAPEAVDAADAAKARSFAARRARDLAAPAEAHARLAALLEKAGRKDEARTAYEAAFRLDPSNAAARTARGDVLVDGKWVPAEVVAYRGLRKRLDEARRGLKAAPSRARPVAERTEAEEHLGVDLARARSPRFLARIDGKPEDAARLCDTAERAVDLLDALLGTAATPGESLNPYLIILSGEGRYRSVVGRLPFPSPEAKALALSQVGMFLDDGTYVGYLVDPAWTLDLAAHKAGEAFLRLRYPEAYQRMWLREAFGVLGAALLLESHETFCVQVEDGSVLRDDPDLPSRWPALLAAEVAKGKDRPLRAIADLDMAQLSYSDVAKACCVILWWEATRPGSTARFLDAVARGRPAEEAAVEAFGAGLDAQDAAWRPWIAAVAAAK